MELWKVWSWRFVRGPTVITLRRDLCKTDEVRTRATFHRLDYLNSTWNQKSVMLIQYNSYLRQCLPFDSLEADRNLEEHYFS